MTGRGKQHHSQDSPNVNDFKSKPLIRWQPYKQLVLLPTCFSSEHDTGANKPFYIFSKITTQVRGTWRSQEGNQYSSSGSKQPDTDELETINASLLPCQKTHDCLIVYTEAVSTDVKRSVIDFTGRKKKWRFSFNYYSMSNS